MQVCWCPITGYNIQLGVSVVQNCRGTQRIMNAVLIIVVCDLNILYLKNGWEQLASCSECCRFMNHKI